ncbi:hypothetical protein MNEG_4253 [Monoraphidium neglectum]|uniref:Uncharacterized protein n=1 Tax=Monoraphidium neglectum TaxID=145388 RepID=A0A0D2MLF4_9CHLO|nr:hypothetical protein MNEG_4253 [Monoraphidium neglectum]KIZ03700.1 hypothetical protein MNEG_4253 [Monoraphidium neglectum]|eukprot:XP_013902719.1 hypothetical protein MNEG_4253 [Monoraphidium neglectum]
MKFCLSTDVAFKLSLSAPKLTVSAGARVYINGALAASDPSGGKAGGGSGRITKDLKKRALVAGLNVIAVQVSDMGSPAVAGFDIDLSYLWNEPLVASFLPESCQ